MSMEQAIDSWNGKSADDIGEIFRRYNNDDVFISNIMRCLQQVRLQKGASWLLKRHLETDHDMQAHDVEDLFTMFVKLEGWEVKLHLLQCLPFLPIASSHTSKVELFLRHCLMDANKFVRAWAYNGFYELAVQHPEYKEEALQFFNMAMIDEAPSVVARIRNIEKKCGSWRS